MVVRVSRSKRRDILGQRNAPAIPESVAVIERRAMGMVDICSSVRAKRIAVPLTVAMASDSKNHAMRKTQVCRSFAAVQMVRHNEPHAKARYCIHWGMRVRQGAVMRRAGPGRVRSQRAPGRERAAQLRPTRRRTQRSGVDSDLKSTFFRKTKRTMLRI